jgi:hypothetical protein
MKRKKRVRNPTENVVLLCLHAVLNPECRNMRYEFFFGFFFTGRKIAKAASKQIEVCV